MSDGFHPVVCECPGCLGLQMQLTKLLIELDRKNNQLQALMFELAVAKHPQFVEPPKVKAAAAAV